MSFYNAHPFKYDREQFLDRLDSTYQKWKEAEIYQRRIDQQDAPDRITTINDIYELPVVDMAEFKNNPDSLATNLQEVMGYLYSSGTTSGTRSRAPRSKTGFDRHQAFLASLTSTVLPDVDYFAVIGPSKDHLDAIGDPMLQGRSVFNACWGIASPFSSGYFMELDGGEPTINFSDFVDTLRTREGTRGFFGMQQSVLGLLEYLDKSGENLDLGPDGVVCTGGGAATGFDGRMFRKRVSEVLGVNITNCVDFYGCTESMLMTANKHGDSHPDSKRVPQQGFIYAVDETELREQGELIPVENGTPGVAVIVEAMNPDHPSVILTDDIIVKRGGVYGPDVRIIHKGRASM